MEAIGRRGDIVVVVAVEEIPGAQEQHRQILANGPAAIAVALGVAVAGRLDLRVLAAAVGEPCAARRRAALALDLCLGLPWRLGLAFRARPDGVALLGLLSRLMLVLAWVLGLLLGLVLGLVLGLGLALRLGLILGLRQTLNLLLGLALGLGLRRRLRLSLALWLPLWLVALLIALPLLLA